MSIKSGGVIPQQVKSASGRGSNASRRSSLFSAIGGQILYLSVYQLNLFIFI